MHFMPTPRSSALSITAFLLLTYVGSSPARAEDAPSQDFGALVNGLTGQLDARDGAKYWALVSKLEALGKDAVPALRTKLKGSTEKVRLACAKAVVVLGDVEARGEAVGTLEELAQSEA